MPMRLSEVSYSDRSVQSDHTVPQQIIYQMIVSYYIKLCVVYEVSYDCIDSVLGHSKTNRPTLNTLIFQKNLKLGLWGSLTR